VRQQTGSDHFTHDSSFGSSDRQGLFDGSNDKAAGRGDDLDGVSMLLAASAIPAPT
jgi:hypothetical protein